MPKDEDNEVRVIYDFTYTTKDHRIINVKTGEKLFLINKTNKDWWQVIRSREERPFFVPANYVKEGKNEPNEYQNLNLFNKPPESAPKSFREDEKLAPKVSNNLPEGGRLENGPKFSDGSKSKPVPKTRTKIPTLSRDNEVDSDSSNDKKPDSDRNNSYNRSMKQYDSPRKTTAKKKSLETGRNLSRSLEKLAEEIQFQPKIRTGGSTVSVHKLPSEKCENVLESGSLDKQTARKEAKLKADEIWKITQIQNQFVNELNSKFEGRNSLQYIPRIDPHSKLAEDSFNEKRQEKEFTSFRNDDVKTGRKVESQAKTEGAEKRKEPYEVNSENGRKQAQNSQIPALKPELRSNPDNRPKPYENSEILGSLRREKSNIVETPNENSASKSEKEAKDLENMAMKGEKPSLFCGTVKSKKVEPKNGKRDSLRGRSKDASIVLNERKPPSKSKSIFSSFKRKKQACVISSSWEGLDKIVEIEDKPMVNAFGLQRSKTFMTPEKPKPRSRLDAYNPRWTTFKPNPADSPLSEEPSETPVIGNSNPGLSTAADEGRRASAPFSTRKASLVRKERVDSSKQSRLRVPCTPPLDESPLRDLGDGWGEYHVESRPYFFNKITMEKSLKPPRRVQRLQFGGSRDSIASDVSSPSHSAPSQSPKFSSGTSLDRLTPTEKISRTSLDRLTPCEMAPLDNSPPLSSPPCSSPLDNPPSDEEGLEMTDHFRYGEPETPQVPDGWVQSVEKNNGKTKTVLTHDKTGQKWYAAQDKDERIYYYHEKSKESRWRLPSLPDLPKEMPGSIQRSATETGIPQNGVDVMARRGSKDKARSTKTRSMILDARSTLSSEPKNADLRLCRRSGILHRTKIMDHGKKCSKKWMQVYAVLCQSSIYFFKDEKTFIQMKACERVPDTAHVCHKLEGAMIDGGGKLSARKNVRRIAWPESKTEILVQHDDEGYLQGWIADIQQAVDEQPRSRKDSSSSNRNASNDSIASSSPVKVRRTKSIKGKPKGSNEDLSSNDNKSKIGEILKKFILRRPSSDSLRLKGILRDEPVFGCSLEQITENRDPRVPEFVQKCVQVIESTEENLKADGLYRASGNLSQVQKIRLEVDQNRLGILEHEEDVHVLTGSLKLFFRELKEPLILFNVFQTALKACQNPKPKLRIKELKRAMDGLPKANYDTLKFLLDHLVRVQKYKADNRMDMSNLAIVFGPSLTWPAEDSSNMAIDLMYQNRVIEALLKDFTPIFVET